MSEPKLFEGWMFSIQKRLTKVNSMGKVLKYERLKCAD